MNNKYSKLISKFLSKNISNDEIDELEDWLKRSQENREFFDQLNETWQIGNIKLNSQIFNQDEAWNKFKKAVQKSKSGFNKNLILISRKNINLSKYAAGIALLLGLFISLLWFNSMQKTEKLSDFTIVAPKGEKAKLLLPDGSIVWINSGSKLSYKSSFNLSSRNVYLDGEAYFQVSHNKNLPFTVETNVEKVSVIGTHFNIRAFSSDSIVETTLEEGRISLQIYNTRNKHFLMPGQQFIFNKNNNRTLLKKVDTDLYTSWKDNILRFDNEAFSSIIQKLERWYGVDIIVDPQIKNAGRYTMTIKTESLREVLKLIQITSPIKYKIKEDKVYILENLN